MNQEPEPPSVNAIEQIDRAFGLPTILIPIAIESEKPLVNADAVDYTQTQTPEYRALLAKSSIGVQCGAESGQLAGLFFADAFAREAFLKKNPKVREALQTPVAGGMVHWLRVAGKPYPDRKQLKQCMWMGQGSIVLVYDRAKNELLPMENSINGPLHIRFSDLVWEPEDRNSLRYEFIAAQYGDPFYWNKRHKKAVNEPFWARVIAEEAHTFWDPKTRRFYNTYQAAWTVHTEEAVEAIVVLILNAHAKHSACQCLLEYTTNTRVRALVRQMKSVARCEVPGEQAALEKLLLEGLELHKGASVTTLEIFDYYRQKCKLHDVNPIPESIFLRDLPGLIRKLFSVGKCHCISRDKASRGFRNLRIRVGDG